jgi:hypothetical protein
MPESPVDYVDSNCPGSKNGEIIKGSRAVTEIII